MFVVGIAYLLCLLSLFAGTLVFGSVKYMYKSKSW